MAASAALGREARGEVKKRRKRIIAPAAMIPASRVLPPMALLTAVLESAPVTGKPCISPEAILQAPKAIISWLASMV